ncbi:hypothetical protein ACO22_01939 [Paracoccidioides brasiliensis]|uniref:Uncharacterized protein n=1 Tax=Paracoccidioides brasiliensis TaxID=121759 RepID=A0A1D2JK40_PARBR|nr:hypothetical protein ACO22_01939 [Paracoccidioides brasiliensis]
MEANDPVATATTNGLPILPQLNSDSLSSPTPGKRKRVSSPGDEPPNCVDTPNLSSISKKEPLHQTLKDLLQVLEKYDSDLGILKFPLPPNSPVEPDSKRTKLSDATADSQTIESKIIAAQYKTIQEVVDDVEAASVRIVQRRHESEATANRLENFRSSTELVNLSRIFKKHLDNFILRNPFQGTSIVKCESPELQKNASQNKENSKKTHDREDKMVLALFGNPPRGRHLFSSLQHPINAEPDSHNPAKPTAVGIQATINEAALPNGITTSKVIPFNIKNLDSDKGKSRTIADVFSPRDNLPQLQPPRKSRSSKNSNVTWLDPYDLTVAAKYPSVEKKGYPYLPFPSGYWLHYGYEPSVRSENRTQKTDANFGKKLQKPFQNSLNDGDSLFRSAYASFAPSFDSSGASIPVDAKEQIWWDQFGAKNFHALLLSGSDIETQQSDDKISNLPIQPLDENSLEEAVKSYEPEVDKELVNQEEQSDGQNEEKDMEEVLENISDLLRTLNSYRRIRILGQPLPISSEKMNNEASASVDPSLPSGVEASVYETLKSSLSSMIATLPPYAVSKLDGDQLAELNASKMILLENADYPGTMDEDEYTFQQKQISRASQVPNAVRTPTPNVNTPRTSPYQTPPTATNVPLQRYPSNSRAKAVPMNHPPHQAYGTSQRSSSIPYLPNNSPQPYNPSRQPPPQRAGYAQPQFSQPVTPQYNQGGILQQFQRPTQNGTGPYPSQRIASPAQGSPQPFPNRSNHQTPYQQRPQDNPYGSPIAGPHNSPPQRHPNFGASPQRHPYVNSTPDNPQPRYFQQQTPQPLPFPNFPSSQASPAPAGYANSAAAMTYARSAAEQAALMDRNKAQLAEHQPQKSNTPQPSSVRQFSGQGNLPPSNRQNGAPVGSTTGATQ